MEGQCYAKMLLNLQIIMKSGQYNSLRMNDNLLALERSLNRCIERLQELIKTAQAKEILSAMHFTGTLLQKYLQRQDNQTKAREHYNNFEKQINLYRIQLLQTQPSQGSTRLNGEIMKEVEEILEEHRHFKKDIDQGLHLKKALQEKQEGELLNHHLQRIRKCYADHDLDGTWQAVQALRTQAKTSEYLTQRIQNQLQQQFSNYQQEYLKMHRFYSIFEESDGWLLDKMKNNVTLQYKIYEEQRTIGVRVTGTQELDIEMMPFMAIASEIDLQKEYMPFVKVSEEFRNPEANIARNLKVGFSLTKVPLLADRECYFYATGYDRMKTAGSIFILSESFQDDPLFQQKINYPIDTSEDKVYLKLHYFCLEYRPISKSKAYVRLVTKTDFKLSFLPLFLLTATARIFMFSYFQNIVKMAKEFKGSKWQEKVKSNPAMYDFFQSKIDEYFGK